MPSTTPLSWTASCTSSVMSRTARPPVVRSCRSCWKTFTVCSPSFVDGRGCAGGLYCEGFCALRRVEPCLSADLAVHGVRDAVHGDARGDRGGLAAPVVEGEREGAGARGGVLGDRRRDRSARALAGGRLGDGDRAARRVGDRVLVRVDQPHVGREGAAATDAADRAGDGGDRRV